MKKLIQVSLLLSLLLLSANQAFSCSCADPSVREKFRKASSVFVGRILEIKPYEDKASDSIFINEVRFRVERQWKGERKPEITVISAWDNPGWCGDLPLTVGERYLIYADRERNKLAIYADCGPNRIAVYAEKELGKLNNFWFRFFARLYPYPDL
jgi:hypothetical protein